MGDRTKNLLIGLFIIGGCTLLVAMILFLRPTVGDMKKTLKARFTNINQISIGTRVLYAGMPVGEVVAIKPFIDPDKDTRFDILDRFYVYELTIKYDSHVDIYNTDVVTVQTSGLLGEKSISIIPTRPPKGTKPELVGDHEAVYAVSVDPIENVLDEIHDVSGKIQDTVETIGQWFQANSENLSLAVKAVGGAMEQAHKTLQEINENQIVLDLSDLLEQGKETMLLVKGSLEQMQQEHLLTNAAITFGNMKNASFAIDQIAHNLALGKGSIGKLLGEDDFYLRTMGLMSKADTMMNDINHYGILFNLNKGWQRERTVRADLLGSLKTANEFKSYFEKEVDGVNTAMSRISMLIGKASENRGEKMLASPIFKKDFRALMSRVDDLHAQLKTYNEKLSQVQDGNCSE